MQVKSPPKIENFLRSPAGQRFQKFVGMLGSDADGERANASSMANRLLREADLTWGEVLGAGPAPSQGGQQTRIFDLEGRVKIAEQRLRVAETARDRALKESIKLRRDVEVLEMRLREATRPSDDRGPKRDYGKGEEPAPNQSTSHKPRKYATGLQRQINEIVDEIEANVELNDWEQQFCASIRELKYKISEKQVARLKMLAKQADVECDIEPVG